MAGQSKQEEQAEKLYGEIGRINPNIENRWNNYQNPHEFGDMTGQLDKIYGGYEDMINRNTSEQIANQQRGAASSMASRGITGGSILSDTQSDIASNVNKGKMNALSQLGIGKAGQLGDLMKYFNQMNFMKTGQATGVDQSNMQNLFAKYGLKQGALGGLDSDTWLDDTLGVVNSVGNIARGVGSFFGGGG